MGGNKCKAVFYTYKQIGMQSLELFWPCLILAKNLGDVLSRGLSYQDLKAFEARPQSAFRPGLKGLEGLLNGLVQEGRKRLFQVNFFFLQKCLNFFMCFLIKYSFVILPLDPYRL